LKITPPLFSIPFLFFPIDVGKVGGNCVILWLEKMELE